MHSQLPPIYYIIFTGITCFGVLLQAFVLLAYMHEIDIAIPEATEMLCETRNGLLERHHH